MLQSGSAADGTGSAQVASPAAAGCQLMVTTVVFTAGALGLSTGGVVAAYRILVERKSPDEARAELKRYGWKPGKDQVLLNYLNQNMAKLAELLLALQVIDTIPNPLPVL